jgi:hypothetical protein
MRASRLIVPVFYKCKSGALALISSIVKSKNMATYAKDELEEALGAIISTINKCEKVLPKLKENSAQQTLLKRRIKALQISADLIKRELSDLSEENK